MVPTFGVLNSLKMLLTSREFWDNQNLYSSRNYALYWNIRVNWGNCHILQFINIFLFTIVSVCLLFLLVIHSNKTHSEIDEHEALKFTAFIFLIFAEMLHECPKLIY